MQNVQTYMYARTGVIALGVRMSDGTRRRRDPEARRREIITAAAELIVEIGVDALTHRKVAARARSIAALCTAAVFPATFVNYAGQLTDPMLQLAFLLCFIFLETEDFPLFLATMLIGSLAKETILAMAGYYVLFCRHHRNYLLRSVVTCLSAVVVYFGVRLFVLKGSFAYRDVSGVTLQHVSRNWHLFTWVDNTLATCAVFIPFLILGWRKTPRALKQQFFYWLPVIFVSSLFFSWLVEVRNYMPVIFVLSVVTGIFFSQQVESQAPPTLTKS